MLYNHLSGRAWRDAEELRLEDLDSPDGVQVFRRWIETKYLDREVVKVAKVMSEFFKVLKRTPQQDIRDFNQEFDRQAARLKEVGCQLPNVALAWWYLDKLRLDNNAELSLLSSTNNTYELEKLQEAAIIQDRMNRRLWEARRDPKRQQAALVTETMEEDDLEEEGEETGEEDIPELDPETQEAYVAFQNAKSKYRAALRARGTSYQTKTGSAAAEERLKAAKAKSYCSVCKQKGHWHRDPICPMYKETQAAGPGKGAHSTHVVFFTGMLEEHEKLYGITDCACSRTLAGTAWLRRYFALADTAGVPYYPIQQDEVFKFGGKKLFPSDTAWILWFSIKRIWMVVKVAEIAAEVPLLLSRPALAQMQMRFDLKANVADFGALGLKEVHLETTASGHPALEVTAQGRQKRPDWPGVNWSVTETWIPSTASAYMVRSAGFPVAPSSNWTPLFYPKDLTTGVRRMLTSTEVSPETFLAWWKECDHQQDFWVESEGYLDRIHVTPRKTYFDPRSWRTQKEDLRDSLLARRMTGRRLAYHVSWDHDPYGLIMSFQSGNRLGLGCYGLVEAVSDEGILPTSLNSRRQLAFMLAGVKPWEMKKDQLLAKLRELGFRVSGKETVPELRSLLLEQMPEKETTVSISKMTLDQLREKCKEENIAVPQKVTKGWLLRQLRQHAPSSQEVVTFGKYAGYTYAEIPMDYREWAVKERQAKGDSSSPELARLANWWERTRSSTRPTTKVTEPRPDPEETAVIPPPPMALPKKPTTTMSCSMTPQRAKTVMTYRARGSTRPAEDMSETDFSMVSPDSETTQEKIAALEEQLAILKASVEKP